MKRLLLIILLISVFSCKGRGNRYQKSEEDSQGRVKCKVSLVTLGDVAEYTEYYGTVEPLRYFKYEAPVGGFVERINFKEGEFFSKGTPILLLRSEEFESQYMAVKQKYEVMKLFAERGDSSNPEYYETLSELRKLEHIIELMQFRPPFNGHILKIYKREGDVVKEGDEVLELVQSDTLIVKVKIPLRDVSLAKCGHRVLVFDENGKSYEGIVESVPKVAEDGGVNVSISLTSKDLFLGSFVKVRFIKENRKDVLRVPVRALVEKDGRFVVFKVDGGFATWQDVEVGLYGDEFAEILKSELNSGDTVIVEGQYFISHNAPVEIIGIE
ncbi:MAG TPA: HlyD family efflux transporter periplasmic adaptor subunit [Candidatus Hydrothermia bacterium]|nr:HlyD family efflux transporter periplasmic adaptor subunit [Candidatus Hydrothermia bacterium]